MPGPSNSRSTNNKKKKKHGAGMPPANPPPPRNPPQPAPQFPTDILPCLYIPDDSAPEHPVEQRTVFFPPGNTFDDVVCPLLRCRDHDVEMVYSEYLSAVYEGTRPPAPSTQFTMYEVYMDDNGNATRPYNTRAAHMLLRPRSHGPMLVVKVVCTRDPRTDEPRPVRFVPLAARELESAEFRAKKARFDAGKAVYEQAMLEEFTRDGGIVIRL